MPRSLPACKRPVTRSAPIYFPMKTPVVSGWGGVSRKEQKGEDTLSSSPKECGSRKPQARAVLQATAGARPSAHAQGPEFGRYG